MDSVEEDDDGNERRHEEQQHRTSELAIHQTGGPKNDSQNSVGFGESDGMSRVAFRILKITKFYHKNIETGPCFERGCCIWFSGRTQASRGSTCRGS